jgi:hypothetical protein
MTVNRLMSAAVSLLIAGVIALVACTAPAMAKTHATTALVPFLKVKFRHLRGQRLFGDGPYVYVDGGSYKSGTGVLINGSEGRRTSISEPGCPYPSASGGSSMVFQCPTSDGG